MFVQHTHAQVEGDANKTTEQGITLWPVRQRAQRRVCHLMTGPQGGTCQTWGPQGRAARRLALQAAYPRSLQLLQRHLRQHRPNQRARPEGEQQHQALQQPQSQQQEQKQKQKQEPWTARTLAGAVGAAGQRWCLQVQQRRRLQRLRRLRLRQLQPAAAAAG